MKKTFCDLCDDHIEDKAIALIDTLFQSNGSDNWELRVHMTIERRAPTKEGCYPSDFRPTDLCKKCLSIVLQKLTKESTSDKPDDKAPHGISLIVPGICPKCYTASENGNKIRMPLHDVNSRFGVQCVCGAKYSIVVQKESLGFVTRSTNYHGSVTVRAGHLKESLPVLFKNGDTL